MKYTDFKDMLQNKVNNLPMMHHALTGEWLSEEGTHGIETA